MEIAATYPKKQGHPPDTPIYRDITFSNIIATAESGHRGGPIWGRRKCSGATALERVTITADKPFGIFYAYGVMLEGLSF